MSQNITVRNVTLAIILFIAAITTSAQSPSSSHATFNFANVQLQPGERIVQIQVHADASSFEAVSPLPVGWHITIDNDPSWRTQLIGSCYVGAAAIDSAKLNKLHFRMVISQYGGLKFALNASVTVTKDFEHTREIKVTPANLHFE